MNAIQVVNIGFFSPPIDTPTMHPLDITFINLIAI